MESYHKLILGLFAMMVVSTIGVTCTKTHDCSDVCKYGRVIKQTSVNGELSCECELDK